MSIHCEPEPVVRDGEAFLEGGVERKELECLLSCKADLLSSGRGRQACLEHSYLYRGWRLDVILQIH